MEYLHSAASERPCLLGDSSIYQAVCYYKQFSRLGGPSQARAVTAESSENTNIGRTAKIAITGRNGALFVEVRLCDTGLYTSQECLGSK